MMITYDVCAIKLSPVPPLAVFVCLQDVSEGLKLSLNGRIELALADQGWKWLASQLGRNDHLNVRILRQLQLLFLYSIDGCVNTGDI